MQVAETIYVSLSELKKRIDKNSVGNGEAKELICMTSEHELRWGNAGGRAGAGQRTIEGRKQWDNCNSIINKIHEKNK